MCYKFPINPVGKIMKKTLLFLSLLSTSFLMADYSCDEDFSDCCEPECCPTWEFQARVAYFYPTTHLVREIYHGTRVNYQLEAGYYFNNNWEVWLNGTYFDKKGNSVGLHDGTHLTLVPISLGIKYVFCLCSTLAPYIGVGGNCTWMHLTNNNTSHHKVNKTRAGANAKAGLYINFTDYLFIDLFADYLYIPMDLQNANNLGGLSAGGGIGTRF